MSKSGLALLALAGALVFPLPAAAALTVYNIGILGTDAGVTGTITINGPAARDPPMRRQVLSACFQVTDACVTDWDLQITVGGQSTDLFGPGGNSQYFLPEINGVGRGLSYDTSGLYFNFTDTAVLVFESPSIGLGQDLLCLTAGDDCFYATPGVPGAVLAVGGQAGFIPLSGVARIGTLAVPEPATWATMLLGFAAVGAGLRARRSRSALA